MVASISVIVWLAAAPVLAAPAEPAWTPNHDKKFFDDCVSSSPMDASRLSGTAPRFDTNAWMPYYICRAFVDGSGKICGDARKLWPSRSEGKRFAANCRERFEALSLGWLLISESPDAGRRCADFNLDILPPRGSHRRESCSRLAGGMESGALCAGMVRPERGPHDALTMESCLFHVSVLRGEEPGPSPEDPSEEMDVKVVRGSLAAYRRARASSDPELCGDSSICRFLMGETVDACREYAREALASYCEDRLPVYRMSLLQPPR